MLYDRSRKYKPRMVKNHGTKEKYFWLFVVLVFGVGYYSTYIYSVIPPQTGWWQYMAQRLSEGELLYRDMFMYVPPYFAWFTTGLYQLFGANFALYTTFGLVFFRVLPWMLGYLIMTRYAKPSVCAWGGIIGICLTSAYLMDQAYDYNPLIMGLAVLQTYLVVRAYETPKKITLHVLILVEGILCGVQLMLKQNVGIILPVVVIPLLCYICWDKKWKRWYFGALESLVGVVLGVLPAIVYLLATGTLDDCWLCITTALKAKMGEGSILYVAIRNFIMWDDLLIAALLGAIFFCRTSRQASSQKWLGVLLPIAVATITIVYYEYGKAAVAYLSQMSIYYRIGLLAVIAELFGGIWGCYQVSQRKEKTIEYIVLLFFVIFAGCIFVVTKVPNYFAEYFYYTVGWAELKKHILYTMLYFDILLWFEGFYKGIIKGEEIKKIFTIIYTIFMGFMAVSFASACLEELYALLLVPGVVQAIALCLVDKKHASEDKENVPGQTLLATVFCVLGLVICSMSLMQKLYLPYEWHSWRTSSLLGESNVVNMETEGLRGFRLPESDAKTYAEIVKLIEENSKVDDVLYQFPNIPLFNVLTERASIYAAIPYFDVCPDSLAIESAEILKKDPPQLFLWADLSEGRWSIHEQVFRNGNASGQRAIQEFYNSVIVSEYTLLGEWSNNEGETIKLWKRQNGG